MANSRKLSECEKGYRRWVSPPKPKRIRGKAMGCVCNICGDQIYDSQDPTHTADGLAHAKCLRPNEKSSESAGQKTES